MSGLFRTPRPRPAALVLPLLFLPLCGCGEGKYPADLTYPLRTDLIYVEPPTVNPQPFFPSRPGHLDQDIATINERKGKTLDPAKLAGDDRAALRGKLKELFGTPAAPKVEAGDDDKAAVEKLQLTPETLAAGSMLYRRHCLHCHGLDGDGRGPTGPWVSPHPRDYRQGKFKFMSTALAVAIRKPRREDLVRTVRTGIDGSSMPSFSLLTEKELDQVVSYVIHLSLRGEVEFDTMKNILTNNGKDNLEGGEIGEHCDARLKLFLAGWAKSDKVEEPRPYPYKDDQLPESIQRGYALFTNTQGAASCIGCHLDYGRQVPFRYDDWGTLVRPANLTTGVYRGGRRPIDLFWRIKLGVPPSQMPAADLKRDDAKGTDEYWDLVNFVQALPYPQMLPENIRKRIYPEPTAPTKGEHASAR
ncbi:MAG TPA: c-type cytochrome [Gemmataceae bacterium]|nr:c-type cytochrome [Gemmataceae bacterium]